MKKYIQPTYPGERVQVGIKYVPSRCLVNDIKLYQYTAKDEYTRLRHLQVYDEANTYILAQFMEEVIVRIKTPFIKISYFTYIRIGKLCF